MIDEEFLEQFGRQLLVKGWTLRCQERLEHLRIGISSELEIARRYLVGAGARSIRTIPAAEDGALDDCEALLLSDRPRADGSCISSCLLTPPRSLIIICGVSEIEIRAREETGSGSEIRTTVSLPVSPCQTSIAEVVAAGAVLRSLMPLEEKAIARR